MIRACLIVYAMGLLAYPVIRIADPESYRDMLEVFQQAKNASSEQLQTVAGLHWLKNAYLAYVFLLLARFIGDSNRHSDLTRAGALLALFPVLLLIYNALAQIVLSQDLEDLELTVKLESVLGFYLAAGLALLGIARALKPRISENTLSEHTTSGSNPDNHDA